MVNVKKIVLFTIISFFLFSMYYVSFGINAVLVNKAEDKYELQIEMNYKEEGKDYKKRKVYVPGQTDTKVSISYYDEILFNGDRDDIPEYQKESYNFMIIGISVFLAVYWIILLLIFEKEDKNSFTYENPDDIKTLRKYNPMVAGGFAGNRDVLFRDVIAVVLNLIQKDYIKMEMIPNLKNEKENYIYMISENKEKRGGMDKIETYVFNWIFGFYEEEKVDLLKKLKELSKRKDFLKRMNALNNITKEKLHKMGANIPRVPIGIRILDIFLVLISIILSVLHITNNGLSIHIYQSTSWLFYIIPFCIILCLPLIALIIHIILVLVILLKKLVKSTTEICSGKKIIETSALILTFIFLSVVIIYIFVPNKYICLDVIMIGMSILIARTDHLMTKHNKKILKEYDALNEIKYRIEEYSLIKDEQINYIKLWDEYFVYAVAFGIPIPIVKKIKGSTYKENEDLIYLAKCECLYYICKAYLEVIWDMKFSNWYSLKRLSK